MGVTKTLAWAPQPEVTLQKIKIAFASRIPNLSQGC